VRKAAVLVLLSLIVAACGSDGDDNEGSGGNGNGDGGGEEITIALGSEPTTLDPQIREDGGERAVNDNVYETLVARDKDGELKPSLAAEMPTQVDDTHWEVKLRDGIKFHNGVALDAEAVAKSFERIIDPELKSEQSSFFEGIEKIEAVDESTVRFTTKGPDPVFPARLYWIKVIEPGHAEDADFAENPIGTGPYKFVEWQRGQQVVIEANDDYWGDKPTIQKVTYKFVEEPGTRLSGLSAGEFDLITNLLPDDVDRAPKSAHVMGLEHPVFILNSFEGVTADLKVRQAMNLAIDKDSLAKDLYGGFARVDDCQILSPSFFGYNPDLKPYDYDLEQAKQLIDEAGATGKTVTMISTSGRWLKDRELTEAVANFWTEAGLKVDVKIFEFDEYLNRLFDRTTRGPAIFVTSSNELLDAGRQLNAFYHMDGVGGSNKDTAMSAEIDAAAVETDTAKREQMYHEITKNACDQAYFAFLLNIEDVYGMSKQLQWEPRVDAKLIVSEMSLSS
jgi:peptide/nickel transport system substrate-binding protein